MAGACAERGRLACALAASLLLVSACSWRAEDVSADEAWRQRFIEQRSLAWPQSLHFVNRWSLTARVLVYQGEERERLGLNWRYEREAFGAPSRQRIRITDRIGRTVLVAASDASGAYVEESRLETRRERAEAMEDLIEANTGFSIPFDGLWRWMLALDIASLPETCACKDAKAVHRDGLWKVEYQDFDEYAGWLMPQRLQVLGPGLRLQVTLSDWRLGAGAPPLASAVGEGPPSQSSERLSGASASTLASAVGEGPPSHGGERLSGASASTLAAPMGEGPPNHGSERLSGASASTLAAPMGEGPPSHGGERLSGASASTLASAVGEGPPSHGSERLSGASASTQAAPMGEGFAGQRALIPSPAPASGPARRAQPAAEPSQRHASMPGLAGLGDPRCGGEAAGPGGARGSR